MNIWLMQSHVCVEVHIVNYINCIEWMFVFHSFIVFIHKEIINQKCEVGI